VSERTLPELLRTLLKQEQHRLMWATCNYPTREYADACDAVRATKAEIIARFVTPAPDPDATEP
jgi:hypothetical protein